MSWSLLIQFAFWSELKKKKNMCATNNMWDRLIFMRTNAGGFRFIYMDIRIWRLQWEIWEMIPGGGPTPRAAHFICFDADHSLSKTARTHQCTCKDTHTHLQRLCCHRNSGFRTIQIKLVIVSDTHSASKTALRCSKHMLLRRPEWLTDYRDSVLFHYVTLPDSI